MNEEILFTGRTHPKALFKSVVIQIVLVAIHVFFYVVWPEKTGWAFFDKWGAVSLHSFIVALEIWYVVIPVLQWWNTSFTLTNKRVKMDWGVLYRQSREIDLMRIASISEERGILDRIFGCGTLNFYDAAADAQPKTNGPWNKSASSHGVRFHDVPKIREVRSSVEAAKYSAQRNS